MNARIVVLALLVSPVALAQTKQECASAYTDAQVLRSKQKLREAKKLLAICADDACPPALRKDCVPWLAEVERALPSLVVDVTDASGAAIASAHVTVDGEPATAGQPLRLDPGDHSIVVGGSGFANETQSIKLASGETHSTRITLAPAHATDTPIVTTKTSVPLAPFVVTGAGVVGVALFAAFGVAGNGIKSDLDASGCKPNCSSSRVDAIKTDYIAADVALGVGIAALVVGTILFIVSPWHETLPSASLGTLVVRF